MVCSEPRTLCRRDVPQPRHWWLIAPLLAQLKIHKRYLQVKFLPPAYSRIQGVLSITLAFPEKCSPNQWPQVSNLPYNVATSLATSGLAPELAIKMPPSSPRCPSKSNPRGGAHSWLLGDGLLEDQWAFLGGNE